MASRAGSAQPPLAAVGAIIATSLLATQRGVLQPRRGVATPRLFHLLEVVVNKPGAGSDVSTVWAPLTLCGGRAPLHRVTIIVRARRADRRRWVGPPRLVIGGLRPGDLREIVARGGW